MAEAESINNALKPMFFLNERCQWQVENQYDYDIFGVMTLTVEIYENAIRYSGEFYDMDSGLYYLRARYYNPNIGRFISEDSYWGEDDNPLSLNLYTYCLNDPIKYIDPTGHYATVRYDPNHYNGDVKILQQKLNGSRMNELDKNGFATEAK